MGFGVVGVDFGIRVFLCICFFGGLGFVFVVFGVWVTVVCLFG